MFRRLFRRDSGPSVMRGGSSLGALQRNITDVAAEKEKLPRRKKARWKPGSAERASNDYLEELIKYKKKLLEKQKTSEETLTNVERNQIAVWTQGRNNAEKKFTKVKTKMDEILDRKKRTRKFFNKIKRKIVGVVVLGVVVIAIFLLVKYLFG